MATIENETLRCIVEHFCSIGAEVHFVEPATFNCIHLICAFIIIVAI